MLTRSISKKTESIKYNSVEIGNSNIVGGLSSIKRVSSQVELNDVLKLKHLPQCLIYKIDKNLKVELSDKDDFYVIDVLSLSNEIIPIFNVINEETIDNLIALLNQEEYYDCFVLSSDSSLVKDAKEKLNNIGGIIDYQDSLKNKNKLTKDEMISLRKDLHKNHASIAILPARLCFHEDIQYLYDSVVNVWSEIDNDMDSSFYQAILSGAIGGYIG